MKNQEETAIYFYFRTIFLLLVAAYFGVTALRLFLRGKELYQENAYTPSDKYDKRVNKVLDCYYGASSLGMFQSLAPLAFSAKTSANLEQLQRDVTNSLQGDAMTMAFLNRKIINPLYLAYMRIVSRRIYNGTLATSTTIVYPASSVDIILPLLVVMASQAKSVNIYMIDKNTVVLEKLRETFAKRTQHFGLTKEVEEKIIQRMYSQGYLLSEFDSLNISQSVSTTLILAVLLDKLRIKNLQIENNELRFTFQERRLVFKFITANIIQPESLQNSGLNFIEPYVYIEKATSILRRKDYLEEIFKILGRPEFCLVNTLRLNPDFNKWMQENRIWVGTGLEPSREEVLAHQFIPNDVPSLKPIEHPLLWRLHQAIMQSSSLGFEVTDYHLPTLTR